MSKFCLAILLLMISAASVFAQATPKVELFGGYTYTRNSKDFFNSFNGFDTSLTYNVSRSVGLEANFGGNFRSDTFKLGFQICDSNGNCTNFQQTTKENTHLYTYLFGPKYSYRKYEKVTPFAHALFGGYHENLSGSTETDNPLALVTPPFSISRNDFATAIGGGIDLKVNNKISVRALQADYLLLKDNFTQSNARLSFGIVVKLGKK